MKIDMRVTLALVLALLVQAAGAVFWMGSAAERIAALEASVSEARPVAERLARLEAEVSAMRAQLDRIERKLEAADGR
jgi:Tfp pilus assembly protein PilO